MTEIGRFDALIANEMCRVCLKTNSDPSQMSPEHIELYQTVIGNVAQKEYMKTCIICKWMLQRYSKFKNQCQTANNLLKEVEFWDNKSLLFLQSIQISHNMSFYKLENIFYNPADLSHNTPCDLNEKNHTNRLYINVDDSTNDCTAFDRYEAQKTNQDVKVIMNDLYSVETDSYTNDIKFKSHDDVNDCENDSKVKSDDFEYDFIGLDEDEVPLFMLQETKKKRKRKKKIGDVMQIQQEDTPIKEEYDLKEEEGTKDNRKRAKKLKEGFSSRMVQETNEYIVIKLSREQVLEEMDERSKSDSYLRSPFKCEKCIKGFNFEDVLQTHMEKHSTKNGTFLCNMCDQYCPSTISLRGHIKSHTTRYKCKLCGQVRLSRQHLLEHHAISHTDAPPAYRCNLCQFTSNKRTVMQRHVRRQHSTGESHTCDKCGKILKNIESLRLHTLRHDKSSRFQCTSCDNSFVYLSLLKRHVQCVHERREFYCVECDVQFKSKESLRLHFMKAKKHRDSTAYKYVCPHCPSSFFTSSSLSVHLSAVHNAPKAHACPHCHRLYSTRDAVRAHLWRTHEKREARATCDHCGASFARKSTLKVHLRTHSTARAHSCACGASFSQDRTLQAHILTKHKKDEDVHQYENKIEV